jgi:hypothetical protein
VANAADVPCCDAEDDSTLSKHSLRKSCGLLPSSMYRSRSCDDEDEERVNTRPEKRGSLFETVRVSRLARALRLCAEDCVPKYVLTCEPNALASVLM